MVVARRASLEDDLVALGAIVGGLDLDDLLRNEDHEDLLKQIRWVVGSLQRLAGGRLAIAREMRELDDRLGLTPKGMAALRWTIRPEDASATSLVDGPPPEGVADLEARRRRLASDAT